LWLSLSGRLNLCRRASLEPNVRRSESSLQRAEPMKPNMAAEVTGTILTRLEAYFGIPVSRQNRVWTYRNVINGRSLLVGKQLDAY